MSAKYHWFYLESYVYVVVKGNDLLLYNLASGEFLSYINKPHLAAFILELKRAENLYALKVSEEYVRKNRLNDFINDLLEHFIGDLVDVSLSGKKPFIQPPQFDVQEKMKKPGRRTFKNVSKDSFLSLNELTFFVNSACDEDCAECSNAYKQFLWCTRGKRNSELELRDIKKILEETRGCSIKKINIIGGDISKYSKWDELIDLLNAKAIHTHYFIHFFHFKKNTFEKPGQLAPHSKIYLLIDPSALKNPADLKYLEGLNPGRFKMIFLIQQEQDFANVEKVIKEQKLQEFSLQPYFNKNNLDFFRENVFSDQESLRSSRPDMQAIKARKSYNTLNYGKIFITSDKHIYSNLNASPLGSIDNISIAEAVVLELKEQGNWLRVRRDVTPCKDCLLDAICPPLSNVEYATGINNTCDIWEQKNADVQNRQ